MGVKDTANLAMIPAAYAEDKVYSVLPSDGDGDFTFTRTGSGTRINKGGYIETMAENVPRLNYRLDADGNPTGCAELLLEESRANFLARSDEFNLWGDSGVTVTANDTVAPSGAKTADLLTSSANNWRRSQGATITNGGGYVFSCFVKKHTTTNKIRFELYKGASASNLDFEFGINNLTASDSTLTNLKVQKYPNDWYRVSCKLTANGTNFICYAYPSQGYGTSGSAYFWGAQLEQGADFPTSYIPTSGSAVTRNKDSAYNQPFGDLASDYPITVYWKGQITNYNGNNTGFSIYQNGYGSRYLMITFNSTSQLLLRRRDSGGEDLDYISYTTQVGDVKKIAIKFTSNTSAKVFVDGLEVLNLSGGTDIDYSYDCVNIGTRSIAGDTNLRNPADELFVWNKALTDAEMVEITTP
jgi:hypothetical protein